MPIIEENFKKYPHIKIKFGDLTFLEMSRSGLQVSLVSKDLYEKFIAQESSISLICISSSVLVSSFGSKTRLKTEIVVEVTISTGRYEEVFVAARNPVTAVPLGANCFYQRQAVTEFVHRKKGSQGGPGVGRSERVCCEGRVITLCNSSCKQTCFSNVRPDKPQAMFKMKFFPPAVAESGKEMS